MDSFKRRTPSGPSGRTVDGFGSRPAQRTGAQRQAPSSGFQSSSRRLDDFKRSDGFYTQNRRDVQTGSKASAPRRSWEQSGSLPAGMNLDLPEGSKRRSRSAKKAGRHTPRSKFGTFRKWAFRSTVGTLVIGIAVGGLLFGRGYFKLQKVFQGGSTAAALSNEVNPTLLKGEGDGRVNVLLLGAGGETHKGGDLTDTIVVASIDPVNNSAVLLSIPRDLWTKMPNNYMGNYNKVNAAFEASKYKHIGKIDAANKDRQAIQAGFQGVDGVMERVTGIPIHYNLLVDFDAFKQAVDTVGGIDVNAPEELRDPMMAWENGRNPVLAKKGVNSFNGKQALNYVRSRQTSSDFARGERQRIMLLALKDKTANMGTLTNPVKLSGLLNAFGDNVQSDISISDMARMAQIMNKIPNSKVESIGLAQDGNSFVTTGTINGVSVVMPKAGLEDYSKIQAFIRNKMTDGYIARENANVTILNGSGIAGLATEKAEELKSYGYNVGIVDNAPTEDVTDTKIYDLSKGIKKYTLNYLKKRLDVDTTSTTLPTGIVAGQADIVILLGQNASASTQD